MRIREIEIRNFRSLRHVRLEGLGDLTVLIGPNGSGKSNILEALEIFFSDLNLTTDVEKQATAELWFDKRIDVPITMRVCLELQSDEKNQTDDLGYVFTPEVLTALGLEAIPTKGRRLTIERQIVRKVWKNTRVELENTFFLKDGKVTLHKVSVSKAGTQDTDQPPAMKEAHLPGSVDLEAQAQQVLLKNLTEQLKNKFKLIRGPRESTERPAPPTRPGILDMESKAFLTTVALERDRAKEEQWIKYTDDFERFSGRRLQVRGSEVEFRQLDLTLPLDLSGSGDQALLILMRQFQQPTFFYGIEEPETRLHHDYIRKLYRYLREIAGKWQVLVATHSPVFVDKAFLKHTWHTRIHGKETKVTRVEKEELRTILVDLGVRPGDFFFADQVLFVEGRSDETFVPLLAEKGGLDFSIVKVIPLNGKSRGRYHLRVWLEAARDTGIQAYLLLDKNARPEAEEAVRAHLVDRENCMVLDKESLRDKDECDIEDYYPKDLLQQSIQESYGDKISLQKLNLDNGEPVARKITAALGTEAWKVPLAEHVGKGLTAEHVDDELRDVVRFLRRITRRGA
jgi:predicted ATPase